MIDLKTHKLTYQDIGQIDFYVKYFEENIKTEGDNPTIGIVLCSEKNFQKICISIMVLVKKILRKRQKDIYHW